MELNHFRAQGGCCALAMPWRPVSILGPCTLSAIPVALSSSVGGCSVSQKPFRWAIQTWSQLRSRFPNGMLCLISALAWHELTTQLPHKICVAIPRGTEQS